MNMEDVEFIFSLLIVFIAFFAIAFYFIIEFVKKGNSEKIANVKQWLLYGVMEAEKELGSGTGKMKLRLVYDKAVSKFPIVAMIKFATFSEWVDDALCEFREMLVTNKDVRQYVYGPEPNELVEPAPDNTTK